MSVPTIIIAPFLESSELYCCTPTVIMSLDHVAKATRLLSVDHMYNKLNSFNLLAE